MADNKPGHLPACSNSRRGRLTLALGAAQEPVGVAARPVLAHLCSRACPPSGASVEPHPQPWSPQHACKHTSESRFRRQGTGARRGGAATTMRRAAAAGGRRLLLLQADVGPALAGPGAAHLSTSTPAASLWQQALKVAASVLPLGSGGAGGAGGLAAEAHPEAQQRRAQRAQQMHAAAATAPADVGAAVVPAAVPVVLTGSELRRAEPALSNSADDGSSEKSRRRARRRARAAAKAAKAGLAAELPSLQLSAAAAELHTAGGAVQQQQRGKRRRGKEQQPEQQQPQQPELAASPSPAGTAAAAAEQQQEAAAGGADGGSQLPPPLILQDDAHPIREVDISRPAWFILTRLRAAGARPSPRLPPGWGLGRLRRQLAPRTPHGLARPPCLLPAHACLPWPRCCSRLQATRRMWWGARCATCCWGAPPKISTCSPPLSRTR